MGWLVEGLYVLDTDINDWRKWIDYVNHNYLISWYNGKTGMEESKINFDVVNGYLSEDHDLCSNSKIFIGKIQLNCYFFSNTEIENDIDPREIKSITDHEKIIKYTTDQSTTIRATAEFP